MHMVIGDDKVPYKSFIHFISPRVRGIALHHVYPCDSFSDPFIIRTDIALAQEQCKIMTQIHGPC